MIILGIDLGTTNSMAYVWRDGRCVPVPNSLGKLMTPSVVSVGETGELYVGQIAAERLVSHPQLTAAGFKQFMGTGKVYQLGEHSFWPEDLSAMVLRRLKEDAEVFLGHTVEEAVVSVPAYFNDAQRTATKLAGRLAGLRVDRIINEPSAAALAHRGDFLADGVHVVVDLGGGTLDVSVVEMFENIVDIVAVAGDNHLGGNDIDQAILEAFFRLYPQLEVLLSPEERASLLKMAEMCKIALTDQAQSYMVYQRDGQNYGMALDNTSLMNICAPLLGRIKDTLGAALRDASLPISLVGDVILVGGSCRMPLIQRYMEHLTGKYPVMGDSPDYTVAIGAGIVAGIKARDEAIRDMVLTDICPFTLGIRIRRGVDGPELFSPIIPRNTSLPASRVEEYQTIHDEQKVVQVEIFQGESMNVAANLYLGTIEMPVPPLPAGRAVVQVRFTYDINGILEVEVFCEQSGESARRIIVSDQNLAEAEVERRLAQLQAWKTAPREQDVNRALIARGERLFEEHSGPVRERVAFALGQFITLVNGGAGPAHVARMRSRLELLFDGIDGFDDGLMEPEDMDWDVDGDDWDAEGAEDSESREQGDEWTEDW